MLSYQKLTSISLTASNPFELHLASTDDCLNLLNSTETNKSTGPDNIPPFVLKIAKSIVAGPLTNIVTSSFSKSCFPLRWKKSWIKPLFKGGDKDLLTNYQPLSLLPTSSKLIERVVRSQLSSYRDGNNLPNPLHSGFRKRHSTATILLRATNDWYWALDNGLYVDVLFLDVTKAFNTVDHNVHNVSNRQHSTVIGDAYSSTLQVNAGVPQGSVLGPSLFSVLVNDLPSACGLDCTTILFADDTTVYVVGSSVTKISHIQAVIDIS